MKVLILGKNSYIGKNLGSYLQSTGKYQVELIDLKVFPSDKIDFTIFDIAINVTGIAHKRIKNNENEYYKTNTLLAVKLGILAKKSGIKNFIQFSSMSVFGIKTGKITSLDIANPTDVYGKSKLLADEILLSLFEYKNIAIIRPPMIYGSRCKGNYPLLSKFSNYFPFFPNIKNKRSILYIKNLNIMIENLISKSSYGIFYPQNLTYYSSSNLVKTIRFNRLKNTYLTNLFNPFIYLFINMKIDLFVKLFSDLYYDFEMSKSIMGCKNLISFEESIYETEQL